MLSKLRDCWKAYPSLQNDVLDVYLGALGIRDTCFGETLVFLSRGMNLAVVLGSEISDLGVFLHGLLEGAKHSPSTFNIVQGGMVRDYREEMKETKTETGLRAVTPEPELLRSDCDTDILCHWSPWSRSYRSIQVDTQEFADDEATYTTRKNERGTDRCFKHSMQRHKFVS